MLAAGPSPTNQRLLSSKSEFPANLQVDFAIERAIVFSKRLWFVTSQPILEVLFGIPRAASWHFFRAHMLLAQERL